jgi:hypothetical protein
MSLYPHMYLWIKIQWMHNEILSVLVLSPNQSNARPFECQLLSYQVLGCEEDNVYQVLFGCKYI